jgi:hypothetical protein
MEMIMIKYVFYEIVKLKDEKEPEGLDEMRENEVNRIIEEEHNQGDFDEPGNVEDKYAIEEDFDNHYDIMEK